MRRIDASRWRVFLLAAILSGGLLPVAVAAEKYVELEIPLRDGRSYSLHDYLRACNRAFRAGYPLESIPDRRVEITPAEKLLLQALAPSEYVQKVQFESDRVLLRLPNPENEENRLAMRRRLQQALGVDLILWPRTKGLVVPPNFQPRSRTLLFIHGLGASHEAYTSFTQACGARGIQVLTFDYPNQGPLALSGQRLAEELTQLSRRYPDMKLAIVAHSMGGLVARFALEKANPAPECVTDLFTVGTPHQGSRVATFDSLLLFVHQRLGKRPPQTTLGEGLGEAGMDLRPRSAFLQELNRGRRPRGVRYHVVLGTRGLASPDEFAELEGELRRLLRRQRLPQEEEQRLIKFFGELDEIVTGKGDGAVTVVSARLPRADSERAFDINHVDLVEGGAQSPVLRHILATLSWSRP
jgi:pimeloyl-ACP methyl ester carboxylesterase